MENNSINITESIIESLNNIFSNIFSSIDNGIYEILDNITFIDKRIIQNNNFIKLFGNNSVSGILQICNCLVLGIFIFYITNYLFSHILYTKIQPPIAFIFKAIIFIALMNNSFWICKQILNIVSLISGSICELGKNIFGEEISFANFISTINNKIYISKENGLNVTSFDGIIKSFTTMGFVNLIFSYSLRYIMIQIFILLIPFGFLCGIYEKTMWIFKSILKSFISLLLEQVLIALILVLSFSFSVTISDNITKILFIGIIYSLMKANTFMYMIFGGITTSISNNIGMIKGKGENL